MNITEPGWPSTLVASSECSADGPVHSSASIPVTVAMICTAGFPSTVSSRGGLSETEGTTPFLDV